MKFTRNEKQAKEGRYVWWGKNRRGDNGDLERKHKSQVLER